jgi:hypothetical protein
MGQGFARPGLGLLGLAFWITLILQPVLTNAQCSGTITLSTQAQVNNFPTRGCTAITGNLIISGSNINNLTGLSSLTSVSNNVRIIDNTVLTNLNGLNNLTKVGGENGGDLRINNNPQLISVAGLSGLTRIGFDLQVTDNTVLPNLDGLNNLTSIGGDLRIQNNPKLISVAGLSGLTSVSFNAQISGNDVLSNLTGLNNLTSIGGDLLIQANPQLSSVAGLSGLRSISFDLRITNNAILTSLTGFSSLTSIGGDLRINNNPQLSVCAIEPICQLLANPPANVAISGNATGCSSVADIQADCAPLSITQPPASSSLVCVGTNVSISVGVSGNARTYQWYKDEVSLGSAQQLYTLNLANVQTTDAGTYRVVVSNSVASLTSTAFSLTVNPYPTASLAADGQLTCAQTSVKLTATGGIVGATYQFSGSAQSSGPSSATASVSQDGPYSVTVTNPGGCSGTATTTVQSNTTAPNATLSNNGPLTVNNSTVTLTATGGATYAFSSGAAQQGGGNTATVTTPGTYQVTVTSSSNGCSATASTVVTGAVSASSCRNGTGLITVVASGNPVKYEWYRNSINSARLTENPAQVRGTSTASLTLINQQVTADYYVRVTDANGSAVVYGPFRMTVNLGCNIYARVGANEVELRISLLGNPVQGEQLQATISGAEGKTLNVQLLDLSGKPIRQQQWQQAEAEQSIDWQLGSQSSGVYLLQATSSDQRQSVKVVKQ